MTLIWAATTGAVGAGLGILAAWDVARRLHSPASPLLLAWLPVATAISASILVFTRPGWWGLPVVLVFIAGGWWVAAIDAHTGRIPNRSLVPLGLMVAATASTTAIAAGATHQLLLATAGATLSGVAIWIAHLISRGGVGFGDVKLAVITGGVTGLSSPLLSLWHLAIAIIAATALLTLTHRKQAPFAPWLIGASVIVTLTGAP